MILLPEMYQVEENLVLRRVTPEDFPLIAQGLTDPEVTRYCGIHYADSEAAQAQMTWYAENMSQGTGEYRTIEFQGEKIGVVGLYYINSVHKNAEIGIWILPAFQYKGLGVKIMRGMLQIGFKEMYLHRIEAVVETENAASRTLMLKSGLKLEGIKRESEFKNGKWISLEFWSVLESEF